MNKVFGLLATTAFLVVAGGCSSPQSTVTGCPPPPEVSVTDATDGMDGGIMDAVAQETNRFGKDLIGMAQAEAITCVEDAGLIWRVYEEDGEMFALTMDYRAERVNVKIEKGIVQDAYSG